MVWKVAWAVKEVMAWVDPRSAKIFLTPLPHVIHLRRPCSTVPNHISLVALVQLSIIIITIIYSPHEAMKHSPSPHATTEHKNQKKIVGISYLVLSLRVMLVRRILGVSLVKILDNINKFLFAR